MKMKTILDLQKIDIFNQKICGEHVRVNVCVSVCAFAFECL